jgi:hypothetical protein
MPFELTNEKLVDLLWKLGFKPVKVAKDHHCSWHHPESECTLVLPANKAHERPRPADLVVVGAQLDLQGHLDQAAFALFVNEGRLPTAVGEQTAHK